MGHTVCKQGIQVDPRKIKAMVHWPRPTNVIEVKSFLGLVDYYKKFIHEFFKIAAPLTQLTRKQEPFVWKDAYE